LDRGSAGSCKAMDRGNRVDCSAAERVEDVSSMFKVLVRV